MLLTGAQHPAWVLVWFFKLQGMQLFIGFLLCRFRGCVGSEDGGRRRSKNSCEEARTALLASEVVQGHFSWASRGCCVHIVAICKVKVATVKSCFGKNNWKNQQGLLLNPLFSYSGVQNFPFYKVSYCSLLIYSLNYQQKCNRSYFLLYT